MQRCEDEQTSNKAAVRLTQCCCCFLFLFLLFRDTRLRCIYGFM